MKKGGTAEFISLALMSDSMSTTPQVYGIYALTSFLSVTFHATEISSMTRIGQLSCLLATLAPFLDLLSSLLYFSLKLCHLL